jgi:chromosomal replication initiator protein
MYAIFFMIYCNQLPSTLCAPRINKLTLLADLCEIVGIEYDVFMGRQRHQAIMDKRHIVISLYKKYSGYTFKQCGIDCGGYDHTTIMHICKKIENYSHTDSDFKNDVLHFESELVKLNT